MTIKYCEVFVKHNTENLWTSTIFWLGYDEQIVLEDSTIIVNFDDDIREVSNKSPEPNFKIEFNAQDNGYNTPSHITFRYDNIDKVKDKFYFNKKPNKNNDGTHTLLFNGMFKNYEHYKVNNNIPSYFNCIYYKYKFVDSILKKINVFSILRIKSSILSPRYQIAYDSDEFSKDELLYLINIIFRGSFKQPSQP
jgi:hypothetical protein